MDISEKKQEIAFAALLVLCIAVVGFAFFFSETQDGPSETGEEFYLFLTSSGKAGILYDVRAAKSSEQTGAVYQCGVDIISKGRLVGKSLDIVACNETECVFFGSGSNVSETMGFVQAKKKLSGMPYLLISAGEPSYAFYQRHMEIVIGGNLTDSNVTCDISAIEET